MSKRTFFKRYIWLFDLIKNNPYITLNEIIEKFNKSILWNDEAVGYSKRTFHRDVNEIEELFGVEIEYDNVNKGYFIDYDIIQENTSLLIESYRIINTLEQFREISKYISTGFHNTGSEHISTILCAIKNNNIIEFSYYKYVGGDITLRNIEPYFLKEFKFRWYIIGKDINDKQVKTFALERVQRNTLIIKPNTNYHIPEDINPDNFFDNSFGIFKLQNSESELVELSFSPLKGKFIKSVPLHKSQKLLIDNKTELRIQLQLQITHDFIMEILSHGCDVIVLKPSGLAERIKNELEQSIKHYNSKPSVP
ncbi:MAG: WYL domain-containing protein [Methanolobus sp.]|jgi:predicted DNA-binding transcriptional regulator YafY|nr:WYL domain-containing protein [Methanolobus sp.]